MQRTRLCAALAVVVLVLAACGPAASATPTTGRSPAATATPAAGTTPAPRAQNTPTPAPTSAPTRPAATSGPKFGGVLKKSVLGDPRVFDPFKITTSDLQDVVGFTHSRLVRFNPGPPACSPYPLQPHLATSWQWLDDRTLEVKLRQGVKYPAGPPYNGREFTASDVVYSVTKQWPKQSWYVAIIAAIEKVDVVDPYTIRFRLNQPLAMFPEKALSTPLGWVLGPEAFAMSGNPDDLDALMENVGLGPFQLVSYSPGVKATLKKTPNWYMSDLPYLDGLELRIMPDISTQSAALRSGILDMSFFRTAITPGLELEKTSPQLNISWCPGGNPVALYMRTDKAPYSDVRVRRAISMAMDREAVLKTVYLGKGVVSPTSVPAYFTKYWLPADQYPPEAKQYIQYNPQAAKKLLAEAGYPNGFETNMDFTAHFPEEPRVAEAVVAFLGEIGIRAKLRPMEYAEYSSVVYQAKYQETAISYVHGAEDPDTVVWDNFYSGGGKFVGKGRNRDYVNDPTLDKMLEQGRATIDEDKLKQLYRDIQIYQVQQQYYVFTAVPSLPTVQQPWVKGVYAQGYIKAESSDQLYKAWLDR